MNDGDYSLKETNIEEKYKLPLQAINKTKLQVYY